MTFSVALVSFAGPSPALLQETGQLGKSLGMRLYIATTFSLCHSRGSSTVKECVPSVTFHIHDGFVLEEKPPHQVVSFLLPPPSAQRQQVERRVCHCPTSQAGPLKAHKGQRS